MRPTTETAAPPLIGRYRPLVKLGSGGMADVYLAVSRTDAGLEKLAVIKRLRADIGTDDAEELAHFRGMFWDEAKLAMLLNHQNVVHTHDACEQDGSVYLVMEYIEGQALNSVLRELARAGRQLTTAQSALIVSEILSGLHYAHELKSLSGETLSIVHRDVSPQNMLLGYDGSVKLVDFGVAKTSSRSTETRAGTLKGKARYMAPEQVVNKDVDRRADIYAAGVVLWELIARKKMVAGTNMVEQLVNVMKLDPERLSTVVPDVDPEIEAIVHKALDRDPANRYQTAQAMREALMSFVSRNGDPRTSELGAIVSELFAAKREEVNTIVRQRLAADAAKAKIGEFSSTPDLLINLDGDHSSERSMPSGFTPIAQLQTTSTGSGASYVPSFTPHGVAQTMSGPVPAQGSRKTTILLVGALMALLVVVGALSGALVSRGPANSPVAAAPPPPAPVPEAKPTAPPTPNNPAPPPPSTGAEARPEAKTAGALAAANTRAPAAPPKWTPPTPAAPPPTNHAPAPAAPAPAAEEGYLTMDTYPWTKVSLNGRVLGTTPLVKIPVPVGTHTLVLENTTDNVKTTATVTIKAGETATKRLALTQ